MKTPEMRTRSGLSALGSNDTLSTSAYTAIGPLALATPRHAAIARTIVSGTHSRFLHGSPPASDSYGQA